MIFETNKDKGRAGLSAAIAYFGMNGYNVSIPLNDTQDYDLVIEKDNIFKKVQCKATGSQDGTIDFRITSGQHNGKICGNLLQTNIDYLFCLNQNGTMFLIPFEDILNSGNVHSIRLREEPPSKYANPKLDTYKYIVTFF
ncbi:MAG: hypothetical protein LIO71_03445 [Ruminococcus sp.]|nr:hypothetical protein [Ruminococcus sp.]